ncbi:hypothetical protein D3C79_48040 [compost metagenome]
MIKPVTIIKVMHSDKVGFHLIPVLHAGRVAVFAATKSNNPLVVVEGFGDFRSEVIPVTGDVTIMNPDGLVLSEVSYEKLMAPARIEEQTEAVLQPIREAMSGDRPIDWEELNKRSEIPSMFPPLNPGGAIQGVEPQQFTNGLSKLMNVYSKDLYLELFGEQAGGLVIDCLGSHKKAHPGFKYTVFHRPDDNPHKVVGYVMADDNVVFVIFKELAVDTTDLSHAYLEAFGLVRKHRKVEIKNMEGLIAFTTPTCGDQWSMLRKDVTTLYSSFGKLQFLPSDGFNDMEELISQDHVDAFAQMFQWMMDLPPNGPWTLYVSPRFDKTLGIMECVSQPHIVVTALGAVAVDKLSAKEKESHGLKYIQDKGWIIDSLLNKQAFTVNLNNKVFDIQSVARS